MVFITKKKMEKKKTHTQQKHNCGVAEALAVCSLEGPDVGVEPADDAGALRTRCWGRECSTV